MALFEFHIHNHVNVDELLEKLNQIIKFNTMSREKLDELIAKADAAETSLNNIKVDIAKIKETLPAEGGLTQAEVDALSSRLDALAGSAAALDAENE